MEELSVGHEPWALSMGNILHYSLVLYHTTLMPDGHTHTHIYICTYNTLYTFNYLALHYITSPYITQITLHYITSCSVPFRCVALHTHVHEDVGANVSKKNIRILGGFWMRYLFPVFGYIDFCQYFSKSLTGYLTGTGGLTWMGGTFPRWSHGSVTVTQLVPK